MKLSVHLHCIHLCRIANSLQLVYLLSAIEFSGAKIDFMVCTLATPESPSFSNAYISLERTCFQKMGRMRKALQSEIDAIKNGESVAAAVDTAPKKAAGRKRKAPSDDDGEEKPKKRGRTKKNAVTEETDAPVREESEDLVKHEPEDDVALSADEEA
jgi:hypothetical protein